jgi:hypothetical protein
MQDKVLKRLKSQIQEGTSTPETDEAFRSLLKDLVRSALVLDTFVRAGAGDCLEGMSEFRGAQDMLALSRDLVDRATGMEKYFSLQQIFDAENEIVEAIDRIKATSLPDLGRLEYSASCKLGWGDIALARQDLDRAMAYYQASRAVAPAAK